MEKKVRFVSCLLKRTCDYRNAIFKNWMSCLPLDHISRATAVSYLPLDHESHEQCALNQQRYNITHCNIVETPTRSSVLQPTSRGFLMAHASLLLPTAIWTSKAPLPKPAWIPTSGMLVRWQPSMCSFHHTSLLASFYSLPLGMLFH